MKRLLTLFLMLPSALLFAEETLPAREKSSFWQTLIMIGIAILFFYFILWRPEQKRRKDMDKKRSGMKKGDKVTAMGIVGTIDKIKENTIVIKSGEGKIEILKGAISDVQASEDITEKEKEEESK